MVPKTIRRPTLKVGRRPVLKLRFSLGRNRNGGFLRLGDFVAASGLQHQINFLLLFPANLRRVHRNRGGRLSGGERNLPRSAAQRVVCS